MNRQGAKAANVEMRDFKSRSGLGALAVHSFFFSASGGRFACQSVACWYALPSVASRASLHARPVNCMLVGNPFSPKPVGRHTAGSPTTLQAVISCPTAGPANLAGYAL